MITNEGNNRNGRGDLPTQLEEYPESKPQQPPPPAEGSMPSNAAEETPAAPATFATRADVKGSERINKKQLAMVGGGLAVALLFFLFTVVTGKSPKRQASASKQTTQQSKPADAKPSKGSVTPVMETVRTPAPDNSSGQLGPNDIRRTRATDSSSGTSGVPQSAQKLTANKPAGGGTLGNVPSFSDTQQRWEEPQPYGSPATFTPAGGAATTVSAQAQQNALKEPSLVFVHSQVQNQAGTATKGGASDSDSSPLLEMAPGTRILAKLETQISSAVQARVVAEVEYTYAIGDNVVIPAGAKVYGQLVQADRSGLVNVKFDEIQLVNRPIEKIDAIGLGLDLGPIKGTVYGKNTGKNFLVRAASGMGSVLAEIAGNNSSAAFSEDDMLRERLAENIGTAGDSEIMNLNANSRIVVSVPADTKIYVVFTKHEQSSSELHRVAATTQ
jgi:hypothetical protein